MKLFLASSLNQSISFLVPKLSKPASGLKVLFIANPADPYKNDKWWIKVDRDAFMQIGCEVIDADLRVISEQEFISKIKQADILHICGGSVLYILQLLKKNNFGKIIIDQVKSGQIIYTGSSAGSMIAAEDLSLSKYDPEEAEFVDLKKIEDFSGLGLVNFSILPHCNSRDFVEGNKKMMEYLPDNKEPQILINDNQAVWVEDDKFQIVTK
jgi:dipeptidase E